MGRGNCSRKRRRWRYFSDAERSKLEALVDDLRRRNGPIRHWRLPTGAWAETLGRDPSSVRRELLRGRMRMGSEDTFVHWCYSARLSAERSRAAASRKGRECDIDRRRDDRTFTSGVAALTQTLLRKSTLKATEGFYSIYAAIEVTKRQVPGFSVSESSVRNWIRAGRLANLTMAKVAIWRRSPSPKDKRTFPCRAKSKQGHHIADRPKEVDELKAYGHCEGDTIVSCSGDTTALYSLIERISDFQWTVKMNPPRRRSDGHVRLLCRRLRQQPACAKREEPHVPQALPRARQAREALAAHSPQGQRLHKRLSEAEVLRQVRPRGEGHPHRRRHPKNPPQATQEVGTRQGLRLTRLAPMKARCEQAADMPPVCNAHLAHVTHGL